MHALPDQKRTHLAAAPLSWSVLECASEHPSSCFFPPPRVACSSFAQKLVAVLLLCSLLARRNAATASASPTTRSCLISSDTLAARLISSWNPGAAGLAHSDPADEQTLDPSEEYAVDTSEQDDATSYSSSTSPSPRTTDGSDAESDRWDRRSRRQDAQTPAPCRCRLHRAASALPDLAFPITMPKLPISCHQDRTIYHQQL
uniref:Uncharacterized protein n=1 Tax=Arundo donax TaxID=35708 RepID=A0A0A9TTC5_ARUDO